MFREKTIIKLRSHGRQYWKLSMGKKVRYPAMGLSRLLRLVTTLIEHKNKVYAIDIIVKRRR